VRDSASERKNFNGKYWKKPYMDIEEVKQALARTEQTLSTAHFGLNILNSGPLEQKSAGLRNVLVFGRSVTFVIQNLKL
ncbi:hypothetical protein, partial [Pseudomonas syringae]|uniref:hypothetical protein n=1 Tax=Pseudomonas syringae TaxID=317 RepID=UPI001F1AD885